MRGSIGARALAPALALLAACGPTQEPPSAWDLHRAVRAARTLEVRVPPGEASARVELAAARLRAEGRLEVRVLTPGAPSQQADLRVWIGGPETPGADEPLARLGVERYRGAAGAPAFRFQGRAYDDPGDALVATLEDPQHPGRPLSLALANDVLVAARCVAALEPASRPGFRTWRRGLLEREGDLEPGGAPAGPARDLAPERARLEAGWKQHKVAGLELSTSAGPEVEALRSWLEGCAAARERVLALLPAPAELPVVHVRLHADAEQMSELTGVWAPSGVGVDGGVDAVADGAGDGGFAYAQALALLLAGTPAQGWLLDAVGAHAARSWWGTPMEAWIAQLAPLASAPAPGRPAGSQGWIELLVAPAPALSTHALVPLRGLLVEALVATRGVEHVRALWRGEARLEADAALQQAFMARLEQAQRTHGETLRIQAALRRAGAVASANPQRGFVLCAPMDPATGTGFGTRACRTALEELAALGASAIALDIVGVLEPDAPLRFGAPAPGPLGGPWSDYALLTTARWAHAHGASVAFMPQLLLQPSSNSAAAMLVDAPAAWERLAEVLEGFLLHMGLLAELGQVELLSLGREHANATLPREASDKSGYLASGTDVWQRLIASTRRVFGGALTYSAGTVEAGWIDFWGALDLVGVELFTSLASPPVSDAEPTLLEASQRLRESLDHAFEVARRAQRPLLITGVGFSATRQAWRDPRRPWGPADEREQQRMYMALQATLREARERQGERFRGFFLWCWSTDPASADARDYSPRGRPARELVEWMLAGA